MIKQKFMDDIAAKLAEVAAASPAKDVEKNARTALTGLLARLDLVTREEFDVQAQVLARTREKLNALEARLVKLEGGEPPPA